MNKIVEFDNQYHIILAVPSDAVSIALQITFVDQDGLQTAIHTLTAEELHQARQDFLTEVGDDDYDVRYVLTEKGKQWLEQMRASDEAGEV